MSRGDKNRHSEFIIGCHDSSRMMEWFGTPSSSPGADERDCGIEVESPDDVRKEPLADGTFAIRSRLSGLARPGEDIVDRDLPGGARLSHVALGEAEGDAAGLEVRNLVVERGRRPVIGRTDAQGRVEGLSFVLPRGCLAVLQAPNGWGKTTFLEALAGTIPIRHGEVRIFERAVHRLPTWERVAAGLTVLQSRDNAFPNLTVEESLDRAAALVEAGVDAIEVSVGIMHLLTKSAGEFVGVTPKRAFQDLVAHRLFYPAAAEAYFLPAARAARRRLKRVPLILVGGIRTTETIGRILAEGAADFISMARPFIREPDLPNRIIAGKRGLVDCVSCNVCMEHEGHDPLQCRRIDKWMLLRHLLFRLRGGGH